jgi:hypothetical protein
MLYEDILYKTSGKQKDKAKANTLSKIKELENILRTKRQKLEFSMTR